MPLWEELNLTNPWWRSPPTWGEIPADFHRNAFPDLVAALESRATEPGTLLVGFRRIGKTVLAKQALRHLHETRSVPTGNILYVDFQEALLREEDPVRLVSQFVARRDPKSPACVALDEIQFITDWDRKIRTLLQVHSTQELVLLATGSSTANIREASGGVLLGRVRTFHLGPMTFGESLRMIQVDPLQTPPARIAEELLRFQVRGGFPGLVSQPSDHEARATLRRLCEGAVIDGDLAVRLGIRNRVTFSKVWHHFATNPGLTLNWRDLPGEFGVARETFEGWVHALLMAGMVVEVEPSQQSGLPLHGRKRYSRIYPVDHALSHAYGVPVDDGHGLEAMVLRHLYDLKQRRETEGLETYLTYWRDDSVSGPNEIDFRMEGDGISLLIEVKRTRQPSAREAHRVARVAAGLGRDRAVLVHGGTTREVTTVDEGGVRIQLHLWPMQDFLLALEAPDLSAKVLHHAEEAA